MNAEPSNIKSLREEAIENGQGSVFGYASVNDLVSLLGTYPSERKALVLKFIA